MTSGGLVAVSSCTPTQLQIPFLRKMFGDQSGAGELLMTLPIGSARLLVPTTTVPSLKKIMFGRIVTLRRRYRLLSFFLKTGRWARNTGHSSISTMAIDGLTLSVQASRSGFQKFRLC